MVWLLKYKSVSTSIYFGINGKNIPCSKIQLFFLTTEKKLKGLTLKIKTSKHKQKKKIICHKILRVQNKNKIPTKIG